MAKTEERIKELRQQIWSRRKRKIKAVSIIIGIIIVIAVILNTKRILTAIFWDMALFRVRTVKVVPESARSLLTGIVEIENPGNLLFLDIDDLNDKISKIREVEKCSIMKEFPSTLKIMVTTRKPWVLIERSWGGILIDREGKILESPENPSFSLRVTGIETNRDSVAEDELWKLGVLQEIEKWYNFYNIQRYFLMEKITITKPTEIVLHEAESIRRIIITSDNIEETFGKIKIVLDECEKSGKEWEYIDGRFRDPSVKYKISGNTDRNNKRE
ncbi:MAG TPA: FtsQ-type POTRA domain-containing protein [bacterium]|nr:FtsQ-type POTRA domain-containing protein [bacterium]HPP29583.1 FtsQ-type POTRA domain-containing protein [bacterium]